MRPRTGPEDWAAERELRRRLHDELAAVHTPPAPLDTVMMNGRALRARRRLVLVAGLAVLTAIGAVVALAAPGSTRPAGHVKAITLNVPDRSAPRGVFASGTVNGKPWRLAARNIADPGAGCLAAVMLNGHDGDLLPRSPAGHASPVTGTVALLPRDPLQPSAGFAFLRVRRDVTRVTARLVTGSDLAVSPVTVRLCGQSFRLAGFAFPARGVRLITAYAPTGARSRYAPPPALFSPGLLPPGEFSAGLWSNSGPGRGVTASGRVGAGRVDRVTWTVAVTLGTEGQCYEGDFPATGTSSLPGPPGIANPAGTASAAPASLRAAGGGPGPRAGHSHSQLMRWSVECQPLNEPPASGISWLPIYSLSTPQVTGYAGTVSPPTAVLVAKLADGARLRVRPAVIAGRKYFALVIRQGTRVERLACYDAAGRELSSTTLFPTRLRGR